MAKIKPFKGFFYNSNKVGELSSVLAPLGYHISDEEKDKLYNLNEYNAIRLFDGKVYETDTADNNKYTRAAEYLKKWIDEGVLVQDDEEAIYLYEETVELRGTKYQNMTFVALLEIEELGNNISMCEEVREVSRQGKYELLKTTNADLSMISCLYSEQQKRLLGLMNELSLNEPDYEFSANDYDIHQRIWSIKDTDVINEITSLMENVKLYITDGQTRYTTCLEHRNYMKAKNPNHTESEPYNYIMVSLFDANSDGVAIMPEHRAIKLPNGFSESYFVGMAQEHFKVEKIIVDAQDESITQTMKKQISTKRLNTVFGVYSSGNYFYRLTLKDTDYIKNELMAEKSMEYCNIDTVVLRELIIKEIFGIYDDYEKCVSTSISTNKCVKEIEAGNADVLIAMNPVKVEQIQAITDNGEKFPFRSLSIFPKPAVGTIINYKG